MRVTIVRSPDLAPGLLPVIRRAALGALLRRSGDALALGPGRSLVLRLADDRELRSLNARFLGNDVPTDVLAFPADDPRHVGDVAVSVERAVAQAERAGTPGELELRLLAVHGLLHCLGHDHATAAEAAAMTARTRELLPDQRVPQLETHD